MYLAKAHNNSPIRSLHSRQRGTSRSPNSMSFAIWAIIIGALLTTMALSGSLLKRLPLSTAMLYLAAGVGLGHAYGFLAVFAAGLALQRVKEQDVGDGRAAAGTCRSAEQANAGRACH